MKILFTDKYELKEFGNMFRKLSEDPSVKSILYFGCIEDEYDLGEFNNLLKSQTQKVFGGLFPRIVYENKDYESGCILVGIENNVDPIIINNISDEKTDIEKEFSEIDYPSGDIKTIFFFVDGLSSTIEHCIEEAFNNFGLEKNYIGGGAGSLSFEQRECIVTNDGLLKDCALMVPVDIESGIGVSHGWRSISDSFRVTESQKNVLIELDGKPAFDVYKAVVEKYSGRSFDKEEFFDISKGFPFGIKKLDSEDIVRDPIKVGENGELICVGEIVRNTYVEILSGNKEKLIEAANFAWKMAIQNKTGRSDVKLGLFIDCISRALFLEDDFKDELEGVDNKKIPLVGALTLGEIANNGNLFLEFYNKTSVIAVF